MTGTGDFETNLPGDAPTYGIIALNNALTGYNQTGDAINLYNTGGLRLGSYVDNSNHSNDSIGTIGSAGGGRITSFNMNDSSFLDMANGHANDVVYINDLGVNGTPNVWTDIDLAANSADKLDISSSSGSGTLGFKIFRLKEDFAGPSNVTVISSSSNLPTLDVGATYTNDYKYVVTDKTDGTLTFTQNNATSAGEGIRDAIAAGAERSFSLMSDYTAGSNLDPIDGNLTIFGKAKQYYISGNNHYSLFYVNSDATLNIFDTVLKDSLADYGGAIYNNSWSTANIYNSTFTGNTAIDSGGGAYGGAIYNKQGTANIYNSTFTGNTAIDKGIGAYGGAIYNDWNTTNNIYNSTFIGNAADDKGGAIYNNGTASVYNSTFTGNTADYIGGAIYNNGTASVYNSTFTGNTASSGGAIYSINSINIYNSTFTGNTTNNIGSGAYGGAIYNGYENTANI